MYSLKSGNVNVPLAVSNTLFAEFGNNFGKSLSDAKLITAPKGNIP
jgi:hypothetical protein